MYFTHNHLTSSIFILIFTINTKRIIFTNRSQFIYLSSIEITFSDFTLVFHSNNISMIFTSTVFKFLCYSPLLVLFLHLSILHISNEIVWIKNFSDMLVTSTQLQLFTYSKTSLMWTPTGLSQNVQINRVIINEGAKVKNLIRSPKTRFVPFYW